MLTTWLVSLMHGQLLLLLFALPFRSPADGCSCQQQACDA
jgi:hypothetical protein